MVPLQRLALPALAFLFLFGSCDRVSTPQESEVPSKLDLTYGIWTDSAEAARDSLRQDRPLLGNITVGDTLWVRVKAEGDTSLIRSVDAFFAGSWKEVPVPVFFPVAWQDSGRQKVKVAIFTEDDQFLDSMFVMVTNRTPVARLPVLPGDGSLRVLPNSPTSIFVQTEDDGRIDSLRWDLDGDGTLDTATSPTDTLHLQWTIERILRARSHPVLRVFARDEDGNESSDSFALSLELPPPSITLSGPDTVSIGDSLHFTTTATGFAPLLPVTWQDDSQGEQWHGTAPANDTVVLVRAILRDSLGNADTAERSVVVLRDVPEIVAQDTIRVHAGRSVRLSAGAVQRFGSILRWGWDLDGDGTFGRPDTTAGIDTVFETKGLRRVGLSATDDDGNVGLGSLLVLVTDSVPTLSVSAPRQLGLGDTATIAALSADPDGDSLVLGIVVVGDTAIGSRRLVRFDSAGTHIVRTTVRSYTPAGTLLAEVSVSDTILVVQDPPRLDLGSDTTIAWGGTWRAAGATASDSTGSIATTEWDWDGDGTWDTLATGWLAPIHRFLGDTGRTVVLARVTDDDGNRVLDSLHLRLDPSPWNVEVSAPSTSPRLSDIVVNLSWTDSMSAGSTVRWTSNDGLDTTRNPVGDADSIVVQGRLGDTLRLSASLVSPSGAISTRTVEVVLEALAEGPEIFLSGPDTVSWGDTILIVAETISNGNASTVSWWDASTGSLGRTVAPAGDTILQLRAVVRDELGRADSAIHTVVVVRDAPVADAGPDLIAHAGSSMRFSGAATQRFGGIVEWAWDLDGDGIYGTSSSSAGIDTTWESTGPRTVVLRVRDDDGNVDHDTILVTVTDSAPSLSVTAPSVAAVRDTLALVATASDPDDDSVVVLWVVDGDTTTGSTRLVAFDSVGIHVVQAIALSFTKAGTLLATSTATDTILVVADPPRLDLGSDTTVAWGGTWRAVSASASDSTGTIATTEWDWDGNGTWDTTINGWSAPSHRFEGDTGSIVVRARVTDDDGNRVVDSLALRVDPAPWGVSLTAPESSPRLADIVVRLSWTDSMPSGTTVRWTSNEDLDTVRSPLLDSDSLILQARLADSLIVTATIRSSSGATTTRRVAIGLGALGAPPTLSISGPDTLSWNDTIRLSAVVSGLVTPASVTWWNQRTGLTNSLVAPPNDTILTLKARIVDSLGRVDSATRTVVVVRDAPIADAGNDRAVHAGAATRLSGAASQRFGSIVLWSWDLDGDGIFRSSAISAGIDTTWQTVGPRTVVLRVQDDDGNVDEDTMVVSVKDSVQLLTIAPMPRTSMGDSVTISASSLDSDGDSLVLAWIVGTDTTIGATRRVAFATAGTHPVRAISRSYTPAGTLLATVGLTDSVLVVADPPKLDLGPDSTIAWGGTWRALRATASDSTGSIATTEWDWDGNGTWDTTINGWSVPSHRFQGDTGSIVVRARVTDDDGNRVVDSLTLRVDPAPWNLAMVAPPTSARLTNIVVKLSWTDSANAPANVRWTSSDGLDTIRNPILDTDSVVVQGRLTDTLRLTATLTSSSGAIETRTVAIVLDALTEWPGVTLFGPDTVSWNDDIDLAAEVTGDVSPTDIVWWNQTTGSSASALAPPNDTILFFQVRITDNLGRVDSTTKTVVVVRDAPIADAGQDIEVHAGTLVRLSGSATQRFGNIVSWAWDLDNDGVFRTSPSSAGIDTTWESVGLRTVVLQVEDDDGNIDHDTILVTVDDQAPTLSLDFPATVIAPNTAALVANAADPDDDSLNVFWVVDGDTLNGASHGVSFSTGGPHSVSATVRTYTRPGGTFLAEVTETGTIEVTSDIAVELVHPDTVIADTSGNGVLLQTQITAPGGLQSIEWSFDNGSEWTSGSLSGDQVWRPEGLGTKTVLVRVTDLFGATDSDTAYVVNASDRPVIDLPDSITVAADSRSAKIPLEASVRFGDISSVRWRWTDADSANGEDQNPEPGSTVVSPLVHTFAPGRFTVHVTVIDVHGDFATDSVVVSAVGIRVAITQAPTQVATRGNVHAEATYQVWPTDSAVEFGFTFDGADFVGTTSIDVRPLEAGTFPLEFWANFQGSQDRVPVTRMVEVVYDPPQIETFSEETIGEGTLKDFSFSATRNIGGIATWIWDLSATLYQEQVRLGIVTDSNVNDGTLSPRPLPVGNFQIGYGVVDDAGDTTWAQRYITVVGAPMAVDDVLGKPGRSGVDVPCEVGVECVIRSNFLLDNDLIGSGLEEIPQIVEVLDGATLQSNSDGSWVSLPAPSVAGPHTFRYVISNGYLKDTGSVEITIYERTEAAGFDPGAVGVAIADNDFRRTWGPGQYATWNQVIPRKDLDLYEYVAFYLDVPQAIAGAQLRTGNAQNSTGQDSVVAPGENLVVFDPNTLHFYLEHGPTNWMVDEVEVHDFKLRVGTRRIDGLGIPGHTAWADYTLPVTFQRKVAASATPDPKYVSFAPTYNCDGTASFDYAIDVEPLQNPHAGDFIRIQVADLNVANDGKGFQDGDITAVFTDKDGKITEIPFKRNESNWIVGDVPTTGGSLALRYTIKGLLDAGGNPQGEFRMSWVSLAGNEKATLTTQRNGAVYYLGTTCKTQ
jgi:hypothetical protein